MLLSRKTDRLYHFVVNNGPFTFMEQAFNNVQSEPVLKTPGETHLVKVCIPMVLRD